MRAQIYNSSQPKSKTHDKVYQIHKYWSRKPWDPISSHILTYTDTGDTVLDPFMGSGVTALESLLNNRKYVGIDLNPVSVFIASNTINNTVDIGRLKEEFSQLTNIVEEKILNLYKTNEQCGKCSNYMILQHSNIGPKFKDSEKGYFFCNACGKRKSSIKRCFSKKERNWILNSEFEVGSYWIPDQKFPDKFYKDRFSYKGIQRVSDMYTNRNLYALSLLLDTIKQLKLEYEGLFLTAFSNTVLHSSKLKSENVRPLGVNNYWVPDDYIEENVWLRYVDRFQKIINAKKELLKLNGPHPLKNYKLLNQSCFKTDLKDGSIDYIITDPPYGDAIQYSELSFIWNAWLGFQYNNEEEVIVNPAQSKGTDQFTELLSRAVSESARVIKKGGFFTLCFHNKNFKIWSDVLNIFRQYNFVLHEIFIVDGLGSTFNNNWSKFSPKTDLYLTFKKDIFQFQYEKTISLEDIIKQVLKEEKSIENYAKIYDKVIIQLIENLYFNKCQIDLSHLTIKKLSSIIENIQHGN